MIPSNLLSPSGGPSTAPPAAASGEDGAVETSFLAILGGLTEEVAQAPAVHEEAAATLVSPGTEGALIVPAAMTAHAASGPELPRGADDTVLADALPSHTAGSLSSLPPRETAAAPAGAPPIDGPLAEGTAHAPGPSVHLAEHLPSEFATGGPPTIEQSDQGRAAGSEPLRAGRLAALDAGEAAWAVAPESRGRNGGDAVVTPDGAPQVAPRDAEGVNLGALIGSGDDPEPSNAPLHMTQPQVAAPAGAGDGLPVPQGTAPTLTTTLPLDLTAPNWPEAIVQDLAPHLAPDGDTLTLTLTPERLGTLQVRLAVENGQAQLFILAQTAEAAATLQQAEPRLAQALEQAGLALGHHEARHDGSASENHGQADGGSGSDHGTHDENTSPDALPEGATATEERLQPGGPSAAATASSRHTASVNLLA